jgi:hypothetical protein
VKAHPGEVSPKGVKAVKIVGEKLKKRTFKLMMTDTLKINLGRNQDKNAEYEGDE